MTTPFPNLARKVKALFFSYGWGITEAQGAMFKIVWGVFALLPFKVFKTISGFSAIAPEEVWGTVLIIFGLLHLVAVIKGGLVPRMIMTTLAFFWWVFVFSLIYQQNHTHQALPFFFVIALFIGLNLARLALERKNAFNKNP